MRKNYPLLPKLFTVIKEGYGFKAFMPDLGAGIIVGIIAVPLAIAFAVASGVKPEQGLYTAVIGGFFISLLGGSRFQIGGPTGAFVVVVAGIMAQHGYGGLVTAMIMAGIMMIIMGLLGMGSFIKFIPYPVTVGFTAGIAVIIAVSQIKDLTGMSGEAPAEFIERVSFYAANMDKINPWDLGIGICGIALLAAWHKVPGKVPGSLVLIILATAAVRFFRIPAETIGHRFGVMSAALPQISFPQISLESVRRLFSPAVTIALLASIESLLSAVVADGMTGRKHRSNAEITAQGVANIMSGLFGGIPATGAIARTAANIKNGGKTPVAGIIHSVTVLFVLLFFGRFAAMIPMAALAAILIVVAYNMGEWKYFAGIFRYPKSDAAIMLVTFLLTVFVDLTAAIEAGILLSMFLLMRRLSDVTRSEFITNSLKEDEEKNDDKSINARKVPEGVEVFEIDGVFFFGAVDAFKNAMEEMSKKPKVFVLRMRKVLSVDAAGLKAIEELHEKFRREGVDFVLSGVHAQPYFAMEKAGLNDIIGRENVTADIDGALARAAVIIEQSTVKNSPER